MRINYWQKFRHGVTYHIYNRAVSNTDLFKDNLDYDNFLIKYDQYFGNYFHTYAYCLIPNHFHLLVEIKSKDECYKHIQKVKTKAAQKYLNGDITINQFLEDQFRRFFSSISLRYNKRNKRRGALFTEKFKRVGVTENKAIYLICYIHHNPIHHGLHSNYLDHRYSSYKAYISSNPTKINKTKWAKNVGGLDDFVELHKNFKVNRSDQLNCE